MMLSFCVMLVTHLSCPSCSGYLGYGKDSCDPYRFVFFSLPPRGTRRKKDPTLRLDSADVQECVSGKVWRSVSQVWHHPCLRGNVCAMSQTVERKDPDRRKKTMNQQKIPLSAVTSSVLYDFSTTHLNGRTQRGHATV